VAVPRPLQALIAPQAYLLSAILLAAAPLCALLGAPWPAAACLLLGLGNLAFFRNPRRQVPEGEHRVVSPADGRVVEIARVEDPDGFVGSAWRIAIFLSIFNVHVNRVPLSGKVRAVRRRGAKFLAAFHRDASERNVQSRLDLEAPDGTRAAVVQITGLIARRIVSYPAEGDLLERGEPYGLICYGSRVELYLPERAEITVERGARVRGGRSVLAELRP
jgi:phosphatidylserine decarboxylase